MGTITEKFAYLKETKALIKSALIEKGQTVSDTDTFRSYAEKVLAIQGGGGSSVVDILPEQELTFVDDPSSGFPALSGFNLFNFVLGETYTVVWGDKTFKCECFEGTMDGIPIIGIGNTAAIGGANNELPFAFGVVTAEGDYNGYCMIASLDGSYSKKVRIYQEASGGVQDERVKYVTFIGLGGVELYRQPVIVGDTCHNPVSKGYISTPTKESTVQYTYTYSGWSLTEGGSADANALEAVTEDRTVYAAFTSTVRQYTITFYDSDGVTVLETKQVNYGSVPSYIPEKDGFSFIGWVPSLTTVREDASYTAQWEERVTFAGGSWDDIIAIADAGEAEEYFAIGDTRKQTLTNGSSVTLTVIGFNHDNLADGSGKAHMTIMYGPYDTTKLSMVEDWNAYAGTLNTTFKPKLPESLVAGIKTVNKECNNSGYDKYQTVTIIPFDLFPLSVEELDIRRAYNVSYKSEEWYDRFTKLGEGYSFFLNAKNTNTAITSNIYGDAWLRQKAYGGSQAFFYKSSMGTTSTGFYDVDNVSFTKQKFASAFAFCI